MTRPSAELIMEARESAFGRDWLEEEIEDLLTRYELCCALSQGPDPDRSAHWAEEAGRIEERLAKYAGYDKRDDEAFHLEMVKCYEF